MNTRDISKQVGAVLERLEETRHLYHNLARPSADLLFVLARLIDARHIVEVGTANGYSAIVLGAAVQTFGGVVESVERHGVMAETASRNIAEAGLDNTVTVRSGSGYKILPSISGPIDLLFLDAAKQEYSGYLNRAIPALRSGSLIVADNMISHADDLREFSLYIRKSEEFSSTVVPIGLGLLVAVYRPGRRITTMQALMSETSQRLSSAIL